MLIGVERVNEMLSHLVLCTEVSTQLSLRLRHDGDSLTGEISLFFFWKESIQLLNFTIMIEMSLPSSYGSMGCSSFSDDESVQEDGRSKDSAGIPLLALPLTATALPVADSDVVIGGLVAPPPTPVSSHIFDSPPALYAPTQQVPFSVNTIIPIEFDHTGPHSSFVLDGVGPDGRTQAKYNDFIYDLPAEPANGQLLSCHSGTPGGHLHHMVRLTHISQDCADFYRLHTSPYVNRVSGAVYAKVPSLDEGITLMMEAIELGEACWLA